MINFPKIRQFKDSIREVRMKITYNGRDENDQPIYDSHAVAPTLEFVGTIKLHGTNASIVMPSGGEIRIQSRKRVISTLNDNHGFAKFCMKDVGIEFWNDQVKLLREKYEVPDDKTIVLYGEWCGGNIQGGVALAKLERMFVIFALRVGEEDETVWPDISGLEFDHPMIKNIRDFEHYNLDIDFSSPGLARNKMVEFTLAVEAECPVAKALGESGVGEGVVWFWITPGWEGSRFWFKVKGDKHSVSKVKTLAPIDVEKVASIDEFISNTVTEQRLLQGLEHLKEMNLELSRSSTGDFLRWVFNDIIEEESDTLEASFLSMKDIGKPVSTMARVWFFKHLDSDLEL